MKPSCAAAAVWCLAYCHEIGYDAYDASKKLTRQFFRRCLVVVVSQSNRNFDHFHCSLMCRGIVISYSYRIRIAIIVITALGKILGKCLGKH